jgi:hypothetical protein
MPNQNTNNRPLVNDINCETGEETVRPMTDEEYATWNETQTQ